MTLGCGRKLDFLYVCRGDSTMTPFRRYTDLAATIHLLQRREITLLNPATWDDRNDAYFMAEYKRLKDAKSVLALCFAERSETYHHWRVFSNGTDGVCIELDKEKLLTAFSRDPQVRTGSVRYKRVDELRNRTDLTADELPFLKRLPYRDEHEFRVVFCSSRESAEFKAYPIKLGWINRITLSPRMSKALSASVRETLQSIRGCSALTISRSTLIENEQWKEVTARIEKSALPLARDRKNTRLRPKR